MSDVKILPRAYTKMILHAAKYPHCSINGILLSAKDSTKSKNTIVDVMPLFHQCLHVTPMAEIALVQVSKFASAKFKEFYYRQVIHLLIFFLDWSNCRWTKFTNCRILCSSWEFLWQYNWKDARYQSGRKNCRTCSGSDFYCGKILNFPCKKIIWKTIFSDWQSINGLNYGTSGY